MNHSEGIWRQRLWIWVPGLIFFALNAAAFLVYRLGYAGDVNSLRKEVAGQNETTERVQTERQKVATLIQRARINRQRVEALYEQRFSTRRQRLTEITAEVKNLASRAGLEPQSINYPEQEIDEYDLIKRSFVFSVEGTYAELRRFINLLELSESYVTLEDTSLNNPGDKGPELQMNLTLSTLFAREDPAAALPSEPPAAPAGSSVKKVGA
jgi:Tfp pilus assembly protein PilO